MLSHRPLIRLTVILLLPALLLDPSWAAAGSDSVSSTVLSTTDIRIQAVSPPSVFRRLAPTFIWTGIVDLLHFVFERVTAHPEDSTIKAIMKGVLQITVVIAVWSYFYSFIPESFHSSYHQPEPEINPGIPSDVSTIKNMLIHPIATLFIAIPSLLSLAILGLVVRYLYLRMNFSGVAESLNVEELPLFVKRLTSDDYATVQRSVISIALSGNGAAILQELLRADFETLSEKRLKKVIMPVSALPILALHQLIAKYPQDRKLEGSMNVIDIEKLKFFDLGIVIRNENELKAAILVKNAFETAKDKDITAIHYETLNNPLRIRFIVPADNAELLQKAKLEAAEEAPDVVMTREHFQITFAEGVFLHIKSLSPEKKLKPEQLSMALEFPRDESISFAEGTALHTNKGLWTIAQGIGQINHVAAALGLLWLTGRRDRWMPGAMLPTPPPVQPAISEPRQTIEIVLQRRVRKRHSGRRRGSLILKHAS